MAIKASPAPPDPLALALEPPTDESPAELWAREQREAQARSISHQIDDQIKAERNALRKRKKPIKVLLLGQSESGKSTTVKNFQLAYAYSSFLEERSAWRAVIHLNLVRSVNAILDVVAKASAPPPPAGPAPAPTPVQVPAGLQRAASVQGRLISPPLAPIAAAAADELDDGLDLDGDAPLEDGDGDGNAADAGEEADAGVPPLTDGHRVLALRLGPLRRVQLDLERRLGAGSTEPAEAYAGAGGAAPWVRAGSGRKPREFFVTSRSGWRSALSRVKAGAAAAGGRLSLGSRDEARVETASVAEEKEWGKRAAQLVGKKRTRPTSAVSRAENEFELGDDDCAGVPAVESAAEVIASCADDMAALWADAGIQALLRHEGVRLEEGPVRAGQVSARAVRMSSWRCVLADAEDVAVVERRRTRVRACEGTRVALMDATRAGA